MGFGRGRAGICYRCVKREVLGPDTSVLGGVDAGVVTQTTLECYMVKHKVGKVVMDKELGMEGGVRCREGSKCCFQA